MATPQTPGDVQPDPTATARSGNTAAPPVRASVGYGTVSGAALDDYANGYGSGIWQNASSGGSAIAPSAGMPVIVLNTGAASANYGRMIHKSISITGLSSADSIVFDLEFPSPGPENGDSITVILSSDGYTGKALTLGYTFQRYLDGRVQLAWKSTDWSAVGGEVFNATTFTYIAVKYIRGSGTAMGAVSKQCIVRGIHSGYKARPKAVLAFDQGYAGVWDKVKPLMDAADMVGTVNVTRSAIDTAGNMTTAQLQALYAAGWDMAIRNGPTHDTFADLASLTAEMVAARQWNTSRGLVRGSDHCIYPVGTMTQYSRAALQAAGIHTGRLTLTRYVTTEVGTPGLYTIPTLNMSGANYFATAKAYLDDCIALGKTAFLYTHDVQDTPPGGGISTADMAAIINYLTNLQQQGEIDLCTISQWYDGLGTAGA